MASTPPLTPQPTIIKIHYDPPEGATLGIRCGVVGGEGNDWEKFYYATKKDDVWVCSIPISKPVEFKPLLQYNADAPPQSPFQSRFSFSSPDLRKSFLSSSSSSLFRAQAQSSYGDLTSPQLAGPNVVGSPAAKGTKFAAKIAAKPRKSLQKEVLMSPIRPSKFSVVGEKDESYAVGANYVAQPGRVMDVYPWFYNWQGSLETIEDVKSTILRNKRNVIVYLPPSYSENPKKSYPVVIMQDAHNLFYENLSYAGRIWRIPFIMDELCAAGVIKEAIVVGITPINREFEYLPSTGPDAIYGGGADQYLDFIRDELKPIITTKYRTNGEYGIAGSSYGGIISLYAWLTRPQEYIKCGCYSPSLRWHNEFMFSGVAYKVIDKLAETHDRHLLYIDAGTDYDQFLVTCKMAKRIEQAFNKETREPVPVPHETTGQTRAAEVFDRVTSVTGVHPDFGIRNIGSVGTVGGVLASGKVILNIGQGHNHSEDSWAKRTPFALSVLLRDEQRDSHWVKEVIEDISSRVLD